MCKWQLFRQNDGYPVIASAHSHLRGIKSTSSGLGTNPQPSSLTLSILKPSDGPPGHIVPRYPTEWLHPTPGLATNTHGRAHKNGVALSFAVKVSICSAFKTQEASWPQMTQPNMDWEGEEEEERERERGSAINNSDVSKKRADKENTYIKWCNSRNNKLLNK